MKALPLPPSTPSFSDAGLKLEYGKTLVALRPWIFSIMSSAPDWPSSDQRSPKAFCRMGLAPPDLRPSVARRVEPLAPGLARISEHQCREKLWQAPWVAAALDVASGDMTRTCSKSATLAEERTDIAHLPV